VQNPGSESEPVRVVKMHEGFRLFCTQNPNTGMFKGKRERLSASFLDRFNGVVFEPLSDVSAALRPSALRSARAELTRSAQAEWVEVVRQRLRGGCQLDETALAALAAFIVQLHGLIREIVSDPAFLERGTMSEVTIRELLKVVKRLSSHRLADARVAVGALATEVRTCEVHGADVYDVHRRGQCTACAFRAKPRPICARASTASG
jgi:hypothetical protein